MNEFKLIIAGGRDFTDALRLEEELLYLANGELEHYAVSIITGMARGADKLAYEFAVRNNVVYYPFPADWDRYGKSAGYRRNEEMANAAHGLLAFWDGKSRGTSHMIDTMSEMNKPVHIIRY